MRIPSTLILGILASTAAASAQQQSTIDLTGLQIRNATNQSRTSAGPIDPAYGYHYAIAGNVRGASGILALLYPTPTPLAQVLEDFQPGSSAGLAGEAYNPTNAHPIELFNDRREGISTLGSITVTYGLTLIAGIRADNVAYFQIDNVVLQPSTLVGYLQFTSGTVTIDRIPVVPGDMNWDGVVNGDDAQDFVLAELDSAAYVATYAHNPLLAGDINRDGILDSADLLAFIQTLLSVS
jgi:hypothetical protein